MSSNRHKTIICDMCGKAMRSDNLKKHTIAKHGNSVTQRGEGRQLQQRDMHTENVKHEKPFERISLANLKSKKYVMLPYAKYQELMTRNSSVNNRDVLRAFNSRNNVKC